jgi:hypothetical protein
MKPTKKESSFGENGENGENNENSENSENNENSENEILEDVPSLLNLEYRISMKGKRYVFPMVIEKITPGPIELPNRRSLLNKDAKYKFVDIMPGDKIITIAMQRLTYTVDHNVFTDVFLITDKDFLIAVSQAKEHFKLAA